MTVIGLDFSGARDAGRRIWVTVAHENQQVLHIDWCFPVADLPDAGCSRDEALSALCNFLRAQTGIVGCDFPFALHRKQMLENNWREWLQRFPARYKDAEALRAETGEGELRRRTDNENQTPMAPLNLRLYRQTFYGIREVLWPLVQEGACVLPMMQAAEGSLWMIEICPASTLKREEIYRPYKGRKQDLRDAREQILTILTTRLPLQLSKATEAKIIDNEGGDALDSVLAAAATWRACQNPELLCAPPESEYAVEGRVFC